MKKLESLKEEISYLKTEYEASMEIQRLENENILEDATKKMENILSKKDFQIRKLERWMERIIHENEKEMKKVKEALELRDKELKELTETISS